MKNLVSSLNKVLFCLKFLVISTIICMWDLWIIPNARHVMQIEKLTGTAFLPLVLLYTPLPRWLQAP